MDARNRVVSEAVFECLVAAENVLNRSTFARANVASLRLRLRKRKEWFESWRVQSSKSKAAVAHNLGALGATLLLKTPQERQAFFLCAIDTHGRAGVESWAASTADAWPLSLAVAHMDCACTWAGLRRAPRCMLAAVAAVAPDMLSSRICDTETLLSLILAPSALRSSTHTGASMSGARAADAGVSFSVSAGAARALLCLDTYDATTRALAPTATTGGAQGTDALAVRRFVDHNRALLLASTDPHLANAVKLCLLARSVLARIARAADATLSASGSTIASAEGLWCAQIAAADEQRRRAFSAVFSMFDKTIAAMAAKADADLAFSVQEEARLAAARVRDTADAVTRQRASLDSVVSYRVAVAALGKANAAVREATDKFSEMAERGTRCMFAEPCAILAANDEIKSREAAADRARANLAKSLEALRSVMLTPSEKAAHEQDVGSGGAGLGASSGSGSGSRRSAVTNAESFDAMAARQRAEARVEACRRIRRALEHEAAAHAPSASLSGAPLVPSAVAVEPGNHRSAAATISQTLQTSTTQPIFLASAEREHARESKDAQPAPWPALHAASDASPLTAACGIGTRAFAAAEDAGSLDADVGVTEASPRADAADAAVLVAAEDSEAGAAADVSFAAVSNSKVASSALGADADLHVPLGSSDDSGRPPLTSSVVWESLDCISVSSRSSCGGDGGDGDDISSSRPRSNCHTRASSRAPCTQDADMHLSDISSLDDASFCFRARERIVPPNPKPSSAPSAASAPAQASRAPSGGGGLGKRPQRSAQRFNPRLASAALSFAAGQCFSDLSSLDAMFETPAAATRKRSRTTHA